MEIIALGGPVVLVLFGGSVIGLSIVLYKLLQYRRYSERSLNAVRDAVDHFVDGDSNAALNLLKSNDCPIAGVVSQGIHWLDVSEENEGSIREEITRLGRIIVIRLSSLNGYVELIAYLAPMLGLLGTVLGMIDVFYGLANTGSNSDSGVLAGGIWEALTTTAVGLVVAIPFAILHSILESRSESIRRSMEDQITRLFTAKLSRLGE